LIKPLLGLHFTADVHSYISSTSFTHNWSVEATINRIKSENPDTLFLATYFKSNGKFMVYHSKKPEFEGMYALTKLGIPMMVEPIKCDSVSPTFHYDDLVDRYIYLVSYV